MDRAKWKQGQMRGRLSRNVPTPSAFFTGRETELRELHDALQTPQVANAPNIVMLHGTDGMGKTQVACRYAHLHRKSYTAVFWLNGESPVGLRAQIAGLAAEFEPPVPLIPDRRAVFDAALDGLAAFPGWLLIVDNADNLPEFEALLPRLTSGRILRIVREAGTAGGAASVEIRRWDAVTGARYLLTHAEKLGDTRPLKAAKTALQESAKELCRELNGLPLALAHAGAAMAQQDLTPDKYLTLYRARALQLSALPDDPDGRAVAVVVSLALELLKRASLVGRYAEEVALWGALAGSDPIPDELVLRGKYVTRALDTPVITDTLDVGKVRATLCAYGLMRHEPGLSALRMHDLTRAALRDRMGANVYGDMQTRFVNAVEAAFPCPTPENWPTCDRLLPHALRCEHHIASGELLMTVPASLLAKTAIYMQHRLCYEDALRLSKGELRVRQLMYPDDHGEIVHCLKVVGNLCRLVGREGESESYLHEAEEMQRRLQRAAEAESRPEPPYDAEARISKLHAFAEEQYREGSFVRAAALYEQALRLTRQIRGSYHAEVATRMGYLARAYIALERYEKAEALLLQTLNISRQTIGRDHPTYAVRLVNLAIVYVKSGRPHYAESLFRQALAIRERAGGREAPETARCYKWQGRMYHAQGNLPAATDALRRALDIYERALGLQYPNVADIRIWLERVQRELEAE